MPISEKAYTNQLAIYLKDGRNADAKMLAGEVAGLYPESFAAHFLLATACFRLKEYETAVEAGKKAYFHSKGVDDMVYSALAVGSSLFMLGRVQEGRDFVEKVGVEGDVELEKLKMAFAAVAGDAKGTVEHYRKLFELNEQAAREMVKKILG
jgi:tetratricopeptide (TPR) repeat protein